MNKKKFYQIFNSKLKQNDIKMESQAIDILWEYMNFLIKENKKYNLTGIENPETIIDRHFLDSLAIFQEIEFNKNDNVLDVGTGAGFPGLVLKIYFPYIKLLLLDSRLKRINFLRLLITKPYFVKPFSDNIEVIHERAEKLGNNKLYREKFDWVVSRAVAEINILVEYTLPFVNFNGYCVLYKGPNYKKELEEAQNSIDILGGEIVKISSVSPVDIENERYLIFIKKVAKTPDKFPRRPGIPKKRPL